MRGVLNTLARLCRGFPATSCTLLATTLLLVTGPATKAAEAKTGKKSGAGDAVFTNLFVFRLKIEIPSEGWRVLRSTPGGWGNFGKRPEVRCTVYEGGKVYTNVAAHLKGAAGSFRSIEDDPNLTLNFEKYAPGQSFHGLKKISLNNSVQDHSFISEKICRELFIAAGVPAPRAGYATLTLNGRDLGLRVLVEGYNKQFLKRYYNNVSGNLYDGEFVKDVTQRLSVNSGDQPTDQSDLKLLAEAANKPAEDRMAALEKILDVEKFLTGLAMEIITCHWDGYGMNKNNWRLYHDMDKDRMVFMPHGMDQMFGVMRVTPQMELTPHMQGLVARNVLLTPEGRQRYLAKVAELTTNVFDVPYLTNRVAEIARAIRPVIAMRNPHQARYHDQQVRWLIQRISQRGESLRQQVAAPAGPLKFDANGGARLSGWKQKVDAGLPTFTELGGKDGLSALQITANAGGGVGSYRAKAVVGKGKYRFEGDVKLDNLVADKNDPKTGGACLRISRGELPRKLTGTTDWVRYVYEFEITEPVSEVELVCEVRGLSGRAIFNARSLRIVKE